MQAIKHPSWTLAADCGLFVFGLLISAIVGFLGGLIMLIAAGLLVWTVRTRDVAGAVELRSNDKALRYGLLAVAALWAIAGLVTLL